MSEGVNPNWLGVAAAFFALGAFFLTYRIAVKMAIKKRVWLSLLATILAIPGVSFATYYFHILPEPAWYYEFRSLLGIEFIIILLGVAGGFAASFLHRLLLIVPLLAVVGLSIIPL